MRTLAKLATATLVLALAGTGLASSASAGLYEDSCIGMPQPQAVSRAGNTAPSPGADSATTVAGKTIGIKVLANDTDAEGDALFVTGTSEPARGDACVDSDGTVEYTAEPSPTDYTATFTYGVTDGGFYRTGTVTVTVTGLHPVRAQVRRRLGHGPARLAFVNTNTVAVVAIGGSPKRDRPAFRHRIEPGQTFVVSTRSKRVVYYIALAPLEDEDLIDFGLVNTRTGHQEFHLVTGDDDFRTRPGARRLVRHWLGQ